MASLLSSPGLGCVVIFPPRHPVHCTPLPAFDWKKKERKKKEEGKEKKGRKGRKGGEGKKDTPNTGTVLCVQTMARCWEWSRRLC